MDMNFYHLKLLVIITIIYGVKGNVVKPTCNATEKLCEVRLRLQEHYTMTTVGSANGTTDVHFIPWKIAENGSTIALETCAKVTTINRSIYEMERNSVPYGDGTVKLAYMFNQTLPGPPIVVYKGQQVVVRVENRLQSEATSVHFHGLHQQNTPWMDGVAGLSHCGILPGETFTYRFIAKEVGTFWYHTHSGAQRSMGAHGALIVLDTENFYFQREINPIPKMDGEFHMVISDWFDRSSQDISLLTKYEANRYYHGFDIEEEQCHNVTTLQEGSAAATIPWRAGLINGKGRMSDRYTDGDPIKVPIETFNVTRGKRYRFRVINSALAYTLRVSIDHHWLYVIASDGSEVQYTPVNFIIMGSGERYDFWIRPHEDVDNYWIRVQTLETFHNGEVLEKLNGVRGILRYEGAPNRTPESEEQPCRVEFPCKVLNCPSSMMRDVRFKSYAHLNGEYDCIFIDQLRSTEDVDVFDRKNHNIKQHVLNFHLTHVGEVLKPIVNGFSNVLPSKPLQIYGTDEMEGYRTCKDMEDECKGKICECTHILEVELGSTVELVLSISIDANKTGIQTTNSHPVHLHGTYLQVLKVVHGIHAPDTGLLVGQHPDLECLDERCYRVALKEQKKPDKYKNGGPPMKDTILLPVGGYVVTRFKALNPGYWFMHCHMEYHNLNGMSLVIKVGDFDQMSPVPKSMNRCGDVDVTYEEFKAAMTFKAGSARVKAEDVGMTNDDATNACSLLIICLVIATGFFMVLAIMFGYRIWKTERHGYTYLPSKSYYE